MPTEERHDSAEVETKPGLDPREYVPPRIVTYTSEEILEQIGPALACSPSPSCTNSPVLMIRRRRRREPDE